MSWQPIETAPKDGTPVLLYCPDGLNERHGGYDIPDKASAYTIGWFGDPSADFPTDCARGWLSVEIVYEFYDYGGMTGAGVSNSFMRVNPSHWQPLPPPPETE